MLGAMPEGAKVRISSRRLPLDAGGCRLVALLGEAGDGQVLRAEYPRPDGLPAPVAWTRLDPEPARARGGAGAWLKAWDGLADLRHPGLLPVHGGGVFEGLPVLVSDLADGPTLLDVLHTMGPLGWRASVDLLIPIASALQFVHGASVGQPRRPLVHGDLRPGRLIVRADAQVRLGGLGLQGIAVPLAGRASEQIDDPRIGLPPESLAGQVAEARTDVFSLGALWAFALLGKAPWEGGLVSAEDRRAGVEALLAPGGPLERVAGRPSRAAELLRSMLAPDPNRRPATIGDAWAQLRTLLAALPEEAPATERLRDGLVQLQARRLENQGGGGLGPDPESTSASTATGRFGRRSSPGGPTPIHAPPPQARVEVERADPPTVVHPGPAPRRVEAPSLPPGADAQSRQSPAGLVAATPIGGGESVEDVGPTRRMGAQAGLQQGGESPLAQTAVLQGGRPIHRAEPLRDARSSAALPAVPAPAAAGPPATPLSTPAAPRVPPRSAAPPVPSPGASASPAPAPHGHGVPPAAAGRPAVGRTGPHAPPRPPVPKAPPLPVVPPSRPAPSLVLEAVEEGDDARPEPRRPIPPMLWLALGCLGVLLLAILAMPTAEDGEGAFTLEGGAASPDDGGPAEKPSSTAGSPPPGAVAEGGAGSSPTARPESSVEATPPALAVPAPIAGTAPPPRGGSRPEPTPEPIRSAPPAASAPPAPSQPSSAPPRPVAKATEAVSGPLSVSHTPIKKGRAGASDLVGARVEGGGTIEVVVLAGPPGGPFQETSLKAKSGARWEGWLRFDVPAGTDLHYWIEARRGGDRAAAGSRAQPYAVPVQ